MFNLIIGCLEGRVAADRVLEYTDSELKTWFESAGDLDVSRLAALPTLLMPETSDSRSEQLARIGHVENVTRAGRNWRFRFVDNPSIAPIDTARIENLATDLGIEEFEFRRTHWAVKNVDVYRVLAATQRPTSLEPTIFRLPTQLPVEDDLVAVMMPFAPQFDDVYDVLKLAVADAGMRCHRADDMWVNDHITDDIISLLWRARVVIADLTGRNANVFYETGIAHTLGRDTIQICQNQLDVPFDLQTVRTVFYLDNDEGRQALRPKVTARLAGLLAR